MKELPALFPENLQDYICENFLSRPYPVMQEMERYAKSQRLPILSPLAGPVLQELIQRFQPKKILELGTAIGYSTLWMLSAMASGAQITSVDREIAVQEKAKQYCAQAKIQPEQVSFVTSDALLYIQEVLAKERYDFIFVDCDKIRYPALFDAISQSPEQKGSILLYDNVLWHGRILPEEFTKPSDRAVQELWQKAKNANYPWTLYTNGDGLLLLRL
ncbi:MAG: O-methyltransferase [Spirochaetota bacterium]